MIPLSLHDGNSFLRGPLVHLWLALRSQKLPGRPFSTLSSPCCCHNPSNGCYSGNISVQSSRSSSEAAPLVPSVYGCRNTFPLPRTAAISAAAAAAPVTFCLLRISSVPLEELYSLECMHWGLAILLLGVLGCFILLST